MANITIFGKGTMGQALGGLLALGGHTVSYIEKGSEKPTLADIVIMAVRYDALQGIIDENREALKGRILVDISNPVDFSTWDDLVVPYGTSSAEQIARRLPDVRVIKAFNTTSATQLKRRLVGDHQIPTVQIAADDRNAKRELADVITSCGLNAVDVGPLKRARELEAFGFLQMSLVKNEKISPTGGYALLV